MNYHWQVQWKKTERWLGRGAQFEVLVAVMNLFNAVYCPFTLLKAATTGNLFTRRI